MPAPAPSPLATSIAAALDWWREAGVDATFSDEAHGWLQEAEPPQAPLSKAPAAPAKAPPPPQMQIGGPAESWPTDLAAFRHWWLSEPSLDEGGLTPRIAPSGEAHPELMVLLAMPEEGDRERLLSGPHGRLLDAFLQAAGLPSAKVYRASVVARHTALPDWPALAAAGLGKVLARHVSLVQPQRLLIFGRNILPLCGHDPAQGTAASIIFNHEGGNVPALAEAGLERLLEKAQLRARLWRRWLDWTDG